MAIAHANDHGDMVVHVHHQFENIDQQNESYLVGMWCFLVTEIMFFGALFLMYTIYRWNYQNDFYNAHLELSQAKGSPYWNGAFGWEEFPVWGALNTTLLLVSSYTMVLAVRAAQLRLKKEVIRNLGLTMALASGFLFVKLYFEWRLKFEHGLYPGPNFSPALEHLHGASPRAAEIFYSLYFAMTGLHGIHVAVGILILGTLAYLWNKGAKSVTEDYVPTEMVGLYWHFVDLVWIFLFPLFYLIPG